MSFDSGGGRIPDPIAIVDDNPEMDQSGIDHGRTPAPKRQMEVQSSKSKKPFRDTTTAGSTTDDVGKATPKNDSSGPKLIVIQDADKKQYWEIARNMWLNHAESSELKFSPRQMEEIVSFAASAMAYANKCIGIDLQNSIVETMKSNKFPGGESDKMLSKIETTVTSLNRRIEALEKAQRSGLEKGNEQMKKIEERCRKMQEATVPSDEEVTYANMVKRLETKTEDSVVTNSVVTKVAVPTRNYFTVLEIEEDRKNERTLANVKQQVQTNFSKEKIKVENVIKTKPGNLCVYFKDKEEQAKGVNILKNVAVNHVKVRTAADRLTHLAIRHVSRELSEDDLRGQLNYYHGEITNFDDKDSCKLICMKEVGEHRRFLTWKMTVANATAQKLLKEQRLFIGLQAVYVDPWAPGHRRCVNCFSPNHRASFPRQCTKLICSICTGSHKARDCTKKEKLGEHKCFVCATCGDDSNHCATIRDCPRLKREATEEAMKLSALIHG